ncbi:hypothetical protein ACI3E1_07485 [Ligilactobacillus sp. LYQ139]|uniref:hypothetical protein n=1 Tax=Ligilactobacillus sp. LYQ139 TaxID=3378800 RepID=UPI003854CA9E
MKGNEGAANKKELSAIAKLPKISINEFMPIELQRQYFHGGLTKIVWLMPKQYRTTLLDFLAVAESDEVMRDVAIGLRRGL